MQRSWTVIRIKLITSSGRAKKTQTNVVITGQKKKLQKKLIAIQWKEKEFCSFWRMTIVQKSHIAINYLLVSAFRLINCYAHICYHKKHLKTKEEMKKNWSMFAHSYVLILFIFICLCFLSVDTWIYKKHT